MRNLQHGTNFEKMIGCNNNIIFLVTMESIYAFLKSVYVINKLIVSILLLARLNNDKFSLLIVRGLLTDVIDN